MVTDDYYLDEIERSQEHQSRRRRKGQRRRKRVLVLVTLVTIALLILWAPSFLSHSPMGRSIVQDKLQDYGFEGEIESFSVGWITPLKVSGIELVGSTSGTHISIDQVDTQLTVTDLLRSSSAIGEVVVRDATLQLSVRQGGSSLEDDLAEFLKPSDSSPIDGVVKIQDASIQVTDTLTRQAWQLAQANATIDLKSNSELQVSFAGVMNDPAGAGGAIQGTIDLPQSNSNVAWRLVLNSESLPLSVSTVVQRRLPGLTAGLPTDLRGDATGAIEAVGKRNGDTHAGLHDLRVRNLQAREPGPSGRVWQNKLASFNGEVSLIGDRVIGRQLKASADFASATLNGAFSRSITLVGVKNNPLRWLEALDGVARAEVDLALMDQALPGLIPIRRDVQLVSGIATAQIDSFASNQGRRSKLRVTSNSIRARAGRRSIVLDPVNLDATVSDQNGQVHAEQFHLTSSFATAVGVGDLKNGHADFQVDFGRLSTMLRPLIDMSDTSLGGSARGKIRWNAANGNHWQMDGDANATNLLVTLPNGKSLKRNSLQAKLSAVGQWGGKSLQELSQGTFSIRSSGLDLNARLVRPVSHPNSASRLPIHIDANGKVETIADLLGPWLPAELHDAGGGFRFETVAEYSPANSRIGDTTLSLTNPKVGYGKRWFKQPTLDIDFKGEFEYPSLNLNSRSLSVKGDAMTLALQGQANGENVDLEVAWRAKLERIQGSVRNRIVRDQSSRFQTAGYSPSTSIAPVQTDDWLVTGDCEGHFTVKSIGDILEIQSNSKGANVAVVQPPGASAQSYTVGPSPLPRRSQRNHSFGASQSRVVWSEPSLQIAGVTRYDRLSGKIQANNMKMIGEWFDTQLSGHAIWNEKTGDIVLKGPATVRMDQVSQRLTALTGTAMDVRGQHQTPLEIHIARDAAQNIAFTVQGNVGWDVGEIGGVRFGRSTVPVRLTETTVEIANAAVPVGSGQVNFAGEVYYRPGPIWMRAEPGLVAQNLTLTPDMTRRWVKYLAPLAANTTNITGTMSVELEEALVVVESPEQSRVRGRILLDGAELTPGPLASQILVSVDQLKSISRLSPTELQTSSLVSMPGQTIEFALRDGIVRHERIRFEADRAQLVTSGDVGLDSSVNLTASIPLHAGWLGRDIADLEGQPVTLPITGTLSRPSIDSNPIRLVMTQLGSQAASAAIANTAENYIQKEFREGIKSIENSFDKGMRTLDKGFDKIFNR